MEILIIKKYFLYFAIFLALLGLVVQITDIYLYLNKLSYSYTNFHVLMYLVTSVFFFTLFKKLKRYNANTLLKTYKYCIRYAFFMIIFSLILSCIILSSPSNIDNIKVKYYYGIILSLLQMFVCMKMYILSRFLKKFL